jgi:4-hydroxy-2-oxoheptanedioate aldolase
MSVFTSEIPVNEFKRRILAGKPQIGLWSSLCSNVSVEIIAGSGFDWILIDTEHVPNEPPMVLSQLQAAVGGTATPIVRVAWNDAVLIKRHIDIGVQTFLVPFVQNAEEARRAVAATRFPQFGGVRGYTSMSRANKFGRVTDYHPRAQEEICVLVQVETRVALQQVEADMGFVGNPSHPRVLEVIAETIERIKSAGKAPGILTSVESEIQRWLGIGALFIAVGSDVGILARGSEALASKYKQANASKS